MRAGFLHASKNAETGRCLRSQAAASTFAPHAVLAGFSCFATDEKTCTNASSSPQLGDYSERVHLAQCALSQPEKMLGMPLDGERKAEASKRRTASQADPLRTSLTPHARRKHRKPTELEAVLVKAHPEPGSPEANALRLVTALGITPTLARFAAAFARNLKLRPACADIGVGYETGRTYLKQIFHKTGTHSQAELAVLLMGVLGDG